MKESSENKVDSGELKRLEDALSAEQAKCKEYLDRLKYLQADFENYRKRVEKEFVEVAQRSNEKLIVNLLNVMDDLERAIETGKKSKDLKALLEGVRMVYKNLQSMLEKEGVEKIDAVGKPFDPLAHEILVKIPTKDHEEGTVIEETRKGFTFKGKVIRPSIVKVACKKNEEGEQS